MDYKTEDIPQNVDTGEATSMSKKRIWLAVTVIVLIFVVIVAALLMPQLTSNDAGTAPSELEPSAELPEWKAAEIEAAFYNLQSESDLIRIVPHGEYYLTLGERRPNIVDVNGEIALYIIAEKDGSYQILSSYRCEPILSPGFVVEVLHFEQMTIVFGGVGEKFVLFPGGEKTVFFDDVEVKAVYSNRQEETAKLIQNDTFLFVCDADMSISDVQFLVDGENVTSYIKVYHSPPEVRQLEASEP